MRLLVVLFMATAVLTHNASACECAELTQESSRAIIEQVAYIFEGTIVALDQSEQPEENAPYDAPVPQNPLYAKARLKITTPYKGGAAGERVEAYLDTMTTCGQTYEPGDTALFLLTRKDKILVQADICNDLLPEHWNELKAGKF